MPPNVTPGCHEDHIVLCSAFMPATLNLIENTAGALSNWHTIVSLTYVGPGKASSYPNHPEQIIDRKLSLPALFFFFYTSLYLKPSSLWHSNCSALHNVLIHYGLSGPGWKDHDRLIRNMHTHMEQVQQASTVQADGFGDLPRWFISLSLFDGRFRRRWGQGNVSHVNKNDIYLLM